MGLNAVVSVAALRSHRAATSVVAALQGGAAMLLLNVASWNCRVTLVMSEEEVMSMARSPLILAIDDSATVCKIIEITLQREGYPVKTFPDGVEALRWLASEEGRMMVPALIMLDVEMPKMNGYQVARHLKAKSAFATTVIVMMSRRDGMVERLKARLCGVAEYMMKPLTTQQLIQIVNRYLGPSSF